MSDERKWEPLRVKIPATLGRADKADVKIDSESVSSKHASLIFKEGNIMLKDLDSTNGTRINGERIQCQVLNEGDLISIGMANFLVRMVDKMPRLFCPAERRTIALAMLPFIIGRLPGSHLLLNDQSISGRHATIYEQNRAYLLKDHKSTNGTRVNGRRVQAMMLQDGDIVKFGRWQAVFVENEIRPERCCLSLLSGENTGKIIELPERLKIGRTSDNDLVIAETPVSSAHAVIYWGQGRYWLHDLGSRNGTRVGGVRIQEVPLQHGDEIMIAKQSMLFYHRDLPKEKFYLVFFEGRRGGEEYELGKSKIVIGRSNNCDICLPNTETSKRHAEIEAREGQFILRDLKSTNGVCVNGKKITEATLQHGDDILIGLQHFIFRNSAMPRPRVLQQEEFVLLPLLRGAYGKPIKLSESCSIGSSEDNDVVVKQAAIAVRHAVISKDVKGYTICDCGTPAGTWVNGQRITETHLEHGDDLVIGKRKFIFKSSLRSLGAEETLAIPAWFSVAAVAVVAFFFIALALVSRRGWEANRRAPSTPIAGQQTQKKDQGLLAECKAKVDQELRQHQYGKALQTINSYRRQLTLLPNKEVLSEQLAIVEQRQNFFQEMVQRLRTSKQSLVIEIAKHGRCNVDKSKIDATGFWAQTPQGNASLQVFWQNISRQQFFSLLEQSGLAQAKPLATARLAIALGNLPEVEKHLVRAWQAQPALRQEISRIYAREVLQSPVPGDDFVVYRDRLVTRDKQRELEKEEQRRQKQQAEEEKRRAAELARQQAEKAKQLEQARTRQREQDEFQLRYTVIDEFVRTYSYSKALQNFRALADELRTPELRQQVNQRIEEITPLARLFQALVKAINHKQLKNDKIRFGDDLIGHLVWASNEEFKVVIPRGQVKHKWYSLHPRQLYDFYLRMELSPRQMFMTGVFCFENKLAVEGNRIFVRLLAETPQSRKSIDRYLAQMLGIPVPKGGFVPYQGKLVSSDEREKRLAGLVKFRGEWVTPGDKEKLEQGLVHHGGKWVLPSEKKLLQKGYRNYKGKWYTPIELANLRSNWEEAWTASTKHYDIRSNTSEEFINELALFMEAAFKEYEIFFGKTSYLRMKIYAFRTYEDYRDYCLNTGHANMLRAGGFASSKDNIGCGWSRNNNRILLTTMIHEGTHLFHYQCARRSRLPSWFAEAVATQFEGYHWDGKNLKVDYISRSRLAWLKRAFDAKNTLPLQDMFSNSAAVYMNSSPEDASTFYSQCWGLYYYMRNHAAPNYKKHFQVFVQRMNRGEYAGREHKAFFDEFLNKIGDIENNWKKFIMAMK